MVDNVRKGAAAPDWQARFEALAAGIEAQLAPGETTLLSFSAEESDFIRFNRALVRQIGRVSQGRLTLRLVAGARQAYSTFTVSGDPHADLDDASAELALLRESLRDASDDPHLLYETAAWQHASRTPGQLPESAALVRLVAACAKGLDFVGFYAGGTIARGFASSHGTRGWYEVANFSFSWSLYDPSGRAIKTGYAGEHWSDEAFASRVAAAAARLPVLGREPRRLAPGRYRAFLAPAALGELFDVVAWSGFSARANASARSILHRLHAGEAAFDPRVGLAESLELGIAPGFNEDGYRRQSVELVRGGQRAGLLTDARSAREYGLAPNGAPAGEYPRSLAMAAGTLAEADVLKALDTGIYVGNLWYVNVSDLMHCRLTGMTRFATFWVERGEIVAPLEAMRFDDSLYGLLGDRLEQIGAHAELLPSDDTWGERATGGKCLPGILTSGFELTL
ncbi:Zn-dependent protease [Burkholderia sp. WAC0059]|uniref:TldD/PmbA family protein n=1 Tax=Burkholderia sp. WAC0059 TaxID=2066022 RepID=UPI000C7F36F0|nr:metallopeptidase TldD-related protein [Burkholderia sp. WAC0059]PLZ00884.1 Zn-dependent protease [Burkholderia sp. WAC0059]